MSEFSPLDGNEGYGACPDEGWKEKKEPWED